MTYDPRNPPSQRSRAVAITVIAIVVVTAAGGISLLAAMIVCGGAIGNWAAPAPFTVALYDGITLSSGDLGDTFDSVTFSDTDKIPLDFEVQVAGEGRMKLRDLAHDPERISQLPQPGGFSGGMLSAAKGPCNLLLWVEGSEVRWIRLSQADCPERIPIFADGTELRFSDLTLANGANVRQETQTGMTVGWRADSRLMPNRSPPSSESAQSFKNDRSQRSLATVQKSAPKKHFTAVLRATCGIMGV